MFWLEAYYFRFISSQYEYWQVDRLDFGLYIYQESGWVFDLKYPKQWIITLGVGAEKMERFQYIHENEFEVSGIQNFSNKLTTDVRLVKFCPIYWE